MEFSELLNLTWQQSIPALFGWALAIVAVYLLYLKEMPLKERILRTIGLIPFGLFPYFFCADLLSNWALSIASNQAGWHAALINFAVYGGFACLFIFLTALVAKKKFNEIFLSYSQVMFAFFLCPLLATTWWAESLADVLLTVIVIVILGKDLKYIVGKKMDKNVTFFLVLSISVTWIGMLTFSQAPEILTSIDTTEFSPEFAWLTLTSILLWLLETLLVKSNLLSFRSAIEKKTLAVTDSLTGLPNSSAFTSLVSSFFGSGGGKDKDWAYVYFDVDHFKLFNEKYGLKEGDAFIKTFASAIVQSFPEPSSIVAREAADRFVALVSPDHLERKLNELAERMKPYAKDVGADVKAGIYIRKAGSGESSIEEVNYDKDKATSALSLIKDRKKVVFSYYEESAEKIDGRNFYISTSLQNALENEWIKVYYQPVVNLKEQKVVSYEALVRWDDPTWGLLSPGQFLPVLEKAHMVVDLDEYVLEKICIDLRLRLDQKAKVVPIGFNLSVQDFELIDVPELLSSMLSRYGIAKRYISIEVDQSAALAKGDDGVCRCDFLRKQGYHVCLVGFGDYKSSIAILKDHVFDQVKVDYSYMRQFSDIKSRRLLKTLVCAGKDANTETVVEGIETKEMNEYAVKIGATAGQGYYYSYPAPIAEIERLLEEKGIKYPAIKIEEPTEDADKPEADAEAKGEASFSALGEEKPEAEANAIAASASSPNLLDIGAAKPSFLQEEEQAPEIMAEEEESQDDPSPAIATPEDMVTEEKAKEKEMSEKALPKA